MRKPSRRRRSPSLKANSDGAISSFFARLHPRSQLLGQRFVALVRLATFQQREQNVAHRIARSGRRPREEALQITRRLTKQVVRDFFFFVFLCSISPCDAMRIIHGAPVSVCFLRVATETCLCAFIAATVVSSFPCAVPSVSFPALAPHCIALPCSSLVCTPPTAYHSASKLRTRPRLAYQAGTK